MARRTLIGFACFATLIAIFYTVENWRGKHAWENYKLEAESKGAVLDWNAYIPPAVPADQNFFDALKMTEWFVGRGGTELSRRLKNDTFSKFREQRLTDTVEDRNAANDYLAWSEQFESDFGLIREALKRPYARMNGDYRQPFEIPIPNFMSIRSVAQTLSLRARCFLLLGQPEKALHDLTLLHDMRRLLEGKPTGKPMTLVAAMMNVAVTGLYVETVTDGLRLKAWRAAELSAIQKQLQQVDLIPFVVSAFDFERVASCHTFETVTATELKRILSKHGESENLWQRMSDPMFLMLAVAPKGWVYQNLVTFAQLMDKFSAGFDSAPQQILPRNLATAAKAIEEVVARRSPYTIIAKVAVPNFFRAAQKLAQNQTKANQAAIVCALEGYRLIHGSYPESLDALMPKFMEKIPRDIIGGEPLKYRRTDDGQFLLYSVGWNETDDGGKFIEGKVTGLDSGEGDWVWRYPAE